MNVLKARLALSTLGLGLKWCLCEDLDQFSLLVNSTIIHIYIHIYFCCSYNLFISSQDPIHHYLVIDYCHDNSTFLISPFHLPHFCLFIAFLISILFFINKKNKIIYSHSSVPIKIHTYILFHPFKNLLKDLTLTLTLY